MFDIGTVVCSWQIDDDMTLWLHGNTRNIKDFLTVTAQQLIANNVTL